MNNELKQYGCLHRIFTKELPGIYDKEHKTVNFDFKEATKEEIRTNEETGQEETHTVQGYSGFQVQTDGIIDYGHIKSQLVEAAYAQKDEFALVINAANGILEAAEVADTWEEFKQALDQDHIRDFAEFNEYRNLCAIAATQVMLEFK